MPLHLSLVLYTLHLFLQECLQRIITALDVHAGEVDVQTKGLVLLGVLIQERSHAACCFAWV